MAARTRSKSKAADALPVQPGLRITHRLTHQSGLVIGSAEASGRFSLVPVALEGSTRRELWPLHLIQQRPRLQQFKALGGSFKAPSGYPLRLHHDPHS